MWWVGQSGVITCSLLIARMDIHLDRLLFPSSNLLSLFIFLYLFSLFIFYFLFSIYFILFYFRQTAKPRSPATWQSRSAHPALATLRFIQSSSHSPSPLHPPHPTTLGTPVGPDCRRTHRINKTIWNPNPPEQLYVSVRLGSLAFPLDLYNPQLSC